MDITITVVLMIVQISLMFAAVFFTLKALSLIHHGKLTGSGGATVAILWVLLAASFRVFG